MPKRAAPDDETDEDHPGPGYELIDDYDARWKVYYNKTEGCYAYAMPEEDAAEIEARAKAERVSVEVYVKRRFGFPDHPPPEGTSRKKRHPVNDNRKKLYREMAHVKFCAFIWEVSAADAVQIAAEAVDRCSSEDIQYEIAAFAQQIENLKRRVMAGKNPSSATMGRVIAVHAWMLMLLGELARRDGSLDAMKSIAAQASLFQENLDLFQGASR